MLFCSTKNVMVILCRHFQIDPYPFLTNMVGNLAHQYQVSFVRMSRRRPSERLRHQNQHELRTTHVITTSAQNENCKDMHIQSHRDDCTTRNCIINCTLNMCSVQLNNSLFASHFIPTPPSTKRI